MNQPLLADTSGAEGGADSSWYIDGLSNGFKLRNSSNFDNNSSGTYMTIHWRVIDSNGNGDISYDLSSNMSNANYPASGEAGGNFSDTFSRIISHNGSTSSTVRVRASNSASHTLQFVVRFSSIIHGDLA